jgi:hypothetical protein
VSKFIYAETPRAVVFAEHNFSVTKPERRTGRVEVTVVDNDGNITNIVMSQSAAAYLIQTLGEVLHSQLFTKEGRT